jgi:hypothetical protein
MREQKDCIIVVLGDCPRGAFIYTPAFVLTLAVDRYKYLDDQTSPYSMNQDQQRCKTIAVKGAAKVPTRTNKNCCPRTYTDRCDSRKIIEHDFHGTRNSRTHSVQFPPHARVGFIDLGLPSGERMVDRQTKSRTPKEQTDGEHSNEDEDDGHPAAITAVKDRDGIGVRMSFASSSSDRALTRAPLRWVSRFVPCHFRRIKRFPRR